MGHYILAAKRNFKESHICFFLLFSSCTTNKRISKAKWNSDTNADVGTDLNVCVGSCPSRPSPLDPHPVGSATRLLRDIVDAQVSKYKVCWHMFLLAVPLPRMATFMFQVQQRCSKEYYPLVAALMKTPDTTALDLLHQTSNTNKQCIDIAMRVRLLTNDNTSTNERAKRRSNLAWSLSFVCASELLTTYF